MSRETEVKPEAPAWSERFWARVERLPGDGACWLWGGEKHKGYGRAVVGGRSRGAHRVAYELLVGPIPVGLQLDHLCRNRGCVNPAHLEPVTNRENVLRGIGPTAMHALKTHCPNGHPYSGSNLHVRKDGARVCRACKAAWNAGWTKQMRRIEALEEALADMVNQFAYWSDGEVPGQITGGLSALEGAFAALGYDEPHIAEHLRCDEPGCRKAASAGWPTRPGGTGLNGGYRRTCGEHMVLSDGLGRA